MEKIEELRKRLNGLQNEYSEFGACDSEGHQAVDRVMDAILQNKPFPLKSWNPFQLYQSHPGWLEASNALVEAARNYWKASVLHKLGITEEEAAPLRPSIDI